MKFWLYSPGENNCKWDVCIQKGIMVFGWGELGHLSKYNDEKELLEAIQIHYGNTSHKNDLKTICDFYNEMRIGDILFVKKGRSKLIGFGIVESNYLYDGSVNDTYKHYKKVKWISFKSTDVNEYKMPYKTLTSLEGDALSLIYSKYKDELDQLKLPKNYYLLSWNPKEWPWNNFEKIISSLKEGKEYIENWRFSNSSARVGDVVYIYKTKGSDGLQGIFASGEIVSEPKNVKSETDGSIKKYANIRFIKVIDLKESKNILTLSTLINLSKQQKWNSQSSGIIIDKCDINVLNNAWNHINGIFSVYLEPQEISLNDDRTVEGKTVRVEVNRYERNRDARLKCIRHFGCCCSICGFDFEKVYGDLGKNFIEVHHLIPINKIKKEYKVNPLTDLIPVCSNCHSMIHRSKNIDQLTSIAAIKKELFNK